MSGHGHETLAAPTAVEVAAGVFAYVQPDGSWWINNTGFITAEDRVLAIDASSTERRTRGFIEAITRVSAAPVRTVINTHQHGDHTNGNCLFDSATIVGHRNCRAAVLSQTIGGVEAIWGPVDWGDLTIRAPELVFDDRLDLFAGDRRIELHYIGTAAHTTGDVVIWLPDDRVLFAGDLVFNGGTPFVLMGSVSGSLVALQTLRGFDAETIVPGHGPVCDARALDDVERYLLFISEVAARACESGLSALDAARETGLGEFADLRDHERIVGNLHRAMAELGGVPPGGQIDVVAALLDMVTFNGGPLRCLA